MNDSTQTTQFETDEFLKLLTDALRSGPGSPQWHEAVTQLRAGGFAEADDYRLLIAAREHLESGREYRSVQAGPGFTRKVMEGIDQEAAGRKAGLPSASLFAWLALGTIVVIVAVVALVISRSAKQPGTISDLAGTFFGKTVVASDFSSAALSEWRKFGLEPLTGSKEQGLISGVGRDGAGYLEGGICLPMGFPPEQPFSVEVTVRQEKSTEDVAVQIFVTEDAQFDTNQSAKTSHELVCYLLNGQLNVAKPDGSLAGEGIKASITNHIVIKLDGQFAIIESDGQRLYAGIHGLSTQKSRYPGIRFLTRRGGGPFADVSVPMIRILKP